MINYIIKIEKNTNQLLNEYKIGEKIKNIPNYEYFFHPIEEIENANIIAINNNDIEEQTTKNQLYLCVKKRDIGKITLDDFFSKLEKKYCAKKIIDCYNYLLKSIDMLNKNGIIHFAIRPSTIFYHEINDIPIITNFRWSFLKTDEIPQSYIDGENDYYHKTLSKEDIDKYALNIFFSYLSKKYEITENFIQPFSEK